MDTTINLKDHFTPDELKSIQQIGEKFKVLSDMTTAVTDGIIRGLIVYGPPGVSKTYSIETVLNEKTLPYVFDEDGLDYHSIRGYMRTPNLFIELWNHRNADDILLIDDCDSALQDQDSLMLLKAALDSTDTRTITYNAQSHFLKHLGIPNTFDFNGRIIFVTNTDFKNCATPKLKEHLAAILDRCHYVDLGIRTDNEKMLWVKYVALTSNIFQKRKVPFDKVLELLDFVESNITNIADLSLRTLIKLSELTKINPETWQETAKLTVFGK